MNGEWQNGIRKKGNRRTEISIPKPWFVCLLQDITFLSYDSKQVKWHDNSVNGNYIEFFFIWSFSSYPIPNEIKIAPFFFGSVIFILFFFSITVRFHIDIHYSSIWRTTCVKMVEMMGKKTEESKWNRKNDDSKIAKKIEAFCTTDDMNKHWTQKSHFQMGKLSNVRLTWNLRSILVLVRFGLSLSHCFFHHKY